MEKVVPIGIKQFSKIREGNFYYIDKSNLISQIIRSPAEAYLFTRPRRFGKSLNMSMLDSFFNINKKEDAKYFEGLKVSSDKEAKQHQNKYPVIAISFKDTYQKTEELFKNRIQDTIVETYRGFIKELQNSSNIDDVQRAYFERGLTHKLSDTEYTDYLLRLSQMIYSHYGVKPIILIDEYDNPVHRAYGKENHRAILDILRNILSSALKDNDYLEFAVITGVMQIAKEIIFSGLNNLKINNVISEQYNEMFGFTEDEVKQLCVDFGHIEKFQEAKEWYDGYRFGNREIYNPWSLLNYIDSGFKPACYWAGTSSNEIIKDLLDFRTFEIHDLLTKLGTGEEVSAHIDLAITFPNIYPENILSVMVATGYLKVKEIDNEDYLVSIPNKEMYRVYGDMILAHTFKQPVNKAMLFSKAILENNVENMTRHLKDFFMTQIGFAVLNDEHSYQAYILGLLNYLGGKYEIGGDFETGNGRADIIMKKKRGDSPNVVMEIKRGTVDYPPDKIDWELDEVIKQIKTREYFHSLKGEIILYGIFFNGKEPHIKSETMVQ